MGTNLSVVVATLLGSPLLKDELNLAHGSDEPSPVPTPQRTFRSTMHCDFQSANRSFTKYEDVH